MDWVSLADSAALDNRLIGSTAKQISKLGLENSSAVMLPAETVIVARDASIGRTAVLSRPMAVSQHFIAWICGPTLDCWFLYYWLSHNKPVLERVAAGSTIKTIGLDFFINLQLELPSIGEQRAIVRELGDVDDLIGALDRLIAKKQAIKLATMQALLAGRRRLPGFDGAWTPALMGEVFSPLSTASCSRAQLDSRSAVAYLHYGDVHAHPSAHVDLRRTTTPMVAPARVARATRLSDGDLVMVDASEDLEGVGKSIEVVGVASTEAVAGLHTIALRPNSGRLALGFAGYLQFIPRLRSQLLKAVQGTSVYGLSRRALLDVQIDLPPLAEQAAIAEVLADMDAELDALDARKRKTQAIKTAMMQDLLTGRRRLV